MVVLADLCRERVADWSVAAVLGVLVLALLVAPTSHLAVPASEDRGLCLNVGPARAAREQALLDSGGLLAAGAWWGWGEWCGEMVRRTYLIYSPQYKWL